MYNVAYDDTNGTKLYLVCPVPTLEQAIFYMRICREKYVGKQYPNKRGFYDVRNVRIVTVDSCPLVARFQGA